MSVNKSLKSKTDVTFADRLDSFRYAIREQCQDRKTNVNQFFTDFGDRFNDTPSWIKRTEWEKRD